MRIPTEASCNMISADVGMSCYNVLRYPHFSCTIVWEGEETHLDGTRKEMSVMRQSCSKRRAIVEGKLGTTFGELQARLKRVNIPPVLDDLFLLLGKVEGRCD